MNAKHAFKPTAFDALESREVLSSFHFSPAHAVPTRHVAPTHAAHTLRLSISPTSHSTTAVAPAATSSPTITLPNVSQDLNGIYNAFQTNGGNAAQLAAQYPNVQFQGNSVGVTVKAQGNLSSLMSELRSVGMSITLSDSAHGLVTGFVPIGALPTVSSLPNTASVSPMYKPTLFNATTSTPVAHTGAMTVYRLPNHFYSTGGTIAYLE